MHDGTSRTMLMQAQDVKMICAAVDSGLIDKRIADHYSSRIIQEGRLRAPEIVHLRRLLAAATPNKFDKAITTWLIDSTCPWKEPVSDPTKPILASAAYRVITHLFGHGFHLTDAMDN